MVNVQSEGHRALFAASVSTTGSAENDDSNPPIIAVLFLSWIVCRVDVVDRPRSNAMNLNDGFFFVPREMVGLDLHNCDAAR